MKHEDARIYKVSPIAWLRNLLNHYSPTCNDKYIHLDQWGDLFNDSYVKNLLQYFGYTLHPTGYDTSHQSGSFEQAHRTLANYIQSMLTGSNLDIKFCSYSLCHAI